MSDFILRCVPSQSAFKIRKPFKSFKTRTPISLQTCFFFPNCKTKYRYIICYFTWISRVHILRGSWISKPISIWSGKGSMQRQLCCSPDGSFQSSMVIRQFPVLPIRGQAVECRRAALNNLRLRARTRRTPPTTARRSVKGRGMY